MAPNHPAPEPIDTKPCPEWVGLVEIGADFGWTARHTGWVLTKLGLRKGAIPVERVISFGLARRRSNTEKGPWVWDKNQIGPLLEHVGIPKLGAVDKIAWRAVDEFLMVMQKARSVIANKKPGYTTLILQGVIKLLDALPSEKSGERQDMLFAIDKHFALSGVKADFRLKLYDSMREDGECIVSQTQAIELKEEQVNITAAATAVRRL